MKVNVPSLTVFIIGFSMISWMAHPLQCQDLSSILNNKPGASDSLRPESEQNSPSTAPPASILPPPPPASILPPPPPPNPIQQNQGGGGQNEPSAPAASLDILNGGPSNAVRAPRNPLEPYLWNIQMAEMSFALNNDATSYGKLITARIHLIEAACLKPIIEGKASTTTELCSNERELVLNDFPKAPAAVCARDGIDSSTCKEAHFKLPVENSQYYPSQKEKAENDFIGITDPTQEINTLMTQLSSAVYSQPESSKEKVDESKIKALDLGARILKLACPEENYSLLPLNRNKVAKQEPVQILKMERPTPVPSRVVATPTRSPNEPVVAFTPAGFELVRLLDRQCRELLTRLRSQIPDAASIVCAEKGKFSPDCLDAQKAEDAKYKKKAKIVPARKSNQPTDPKQKIFKSF